MKKTIHKLRQKTYAEKQRFAFTSALVITAFIALLWLATITTIQPTEDQVANTAQPFESLKNNFMEIFEK